MLTCWGCATSAEVPVEQSAGSRCDVDLGSSCAAAVQRSALLEECLLLRKAQWHSARCVLGAAAFARRYTRRSLRAVKCCRPCDVSHIVKTPMTKLMFDGLT